MHFKTIKNPATGKASYFLDGRRVKQSEYKNAEKRMEAANAHFTRENFFQRFDGKIVYSFFLSV